MAQVMKAKTANQENGDWYWCLVEALQSDIKQLLSTNSILLKDYFHLLMCQGFKVAYVVFKRSSSLDTAMEVDSTKIMVLSDDHHTVQTGMESKQLLKKKDILEGLE